MFIWLIWTFSKCKKDLIPLLIEIIYIYYFKCHALNKELLSMIYLKPIMHLQIATRN